MSSPSAVASIESLEPRRLLAVNAPYHSAPFAVGSGTVTLQAEHYDRGGEGVAYHDTTATNQGGAFRTGEGVDLKRIKGTTNQYRTSDGHTGEWLEFSLNVAATGYYTMEFRVGNPEPGATFHAELPGVVDLTGALAAPDTNSYDAFKSVKKTVVLPAGPQVLRFAFDREAPANGMGPVLDWIRISPATVATTVQRIDVGSSAATTDSLNRSFTADSGFTGGSKRTAPAYDVLGPGGTTFADDALLRTYRAGTSYTFSKSVANGRYSLWLEFAEPDATAGVGKRKFDVSVEGRRVLDDYDVVADAGATRTAVARQFEVDVTDGRLNLAFTGVVGEAMLSALVLLPTDVPAAVLPYAGLGTSLDPVKRDAYETANSVRSASNLRQVGMGILMYANSNRGKYPPDLHTLVRQGYLTHVAFANPRVPTLLPRGEVSQLESAAWVRDSNDYVYRGAGLTYTAPAMTVVAYDNPVTAPGESLNVLYADGHVGLRPRSEIVALYGGPAASPAPAFVRPGPLPTDARVHASASNLRTIGQKLLLYSNDFKGRMPPDLGTLYLATNVAPETFLNPRLNPAPPPAGLTREETAAWINANADYTFRGGGRPISRFDADDVVAYETIDGLSGGINLLFGDGRVEFREMRWALESIGRPVP